MRAFIYMHALGLREPIAFIVTATLICMSSLNHLVLDTVGHVWDRKDRKRDWLVTWDHGLKRARMPDSTQTRAEDTLGLKLTTSQCFFPFLLFF